MRRIDRFWAFGSAVAALVACILAQPLLTARQPAVIVPGLADFHPAWNRGVSFSLFSQNSEGGCLMLIAVLTAISAAVVFAAWRATSRLTAVGYGLILGGALANLLDRARFCAVFDFLYLHLGETPLFVCNLPDIAISAGVVVLLLEYFLPKRA